MTDEFRGFKYAPSYENEVILLFGMLMPHLKSKFVIDEYSGSFPDCFALRDGKEIGIEFELNSNNFRQHLQDPRLSKCKLIVCWENNWKSSKRVFTDINGDSQEIEVYALKEVMKEVMEQTGLSFIQSDKPKYQNKEVWGEESFFKELRRKVDADVFGRVSEIYTLCLSLPEFEVVFGEGAKIATFNVMVKKWQNEKIGHPQPIQIYADGKLGIDYSKLPKNLEMELRKITGDPKWKTGKPKAWCYFDLRNQSTFDMIKKALIWVAETKPLAQV